MENSFARNSKGAIQLKNCRLLIYGAGGLGRQVYELAKRNNDAKWSEMLFLDDACGGRKEFHGTEVMTMEEALDAYPLDELEGIVAVGEPSVREKLYNKLLQNGIRVATVIDKTARIANRVQIGAGSIVCEFTTLHPGVNVGGNTLIQPFAALGHDVQVGNHAVLSAYCSPGGHCKFGDRSFMGMHSVILQGLSVGEDAIVSMGAVVFRDVLPATTVVGNPARVTRGNSDHKVF